MALYQGVVGDGVGWVSEESEKAKKGKARKGERIKRESEKGGRGRGQFARGIGVCVGWLWGLFFLAGPLRLTRPAVGSVLAPGLSRGEGRLGLCGGWFEGVVFGK